MDAMATRCRRKAALITESWMEAMSLFWFGEASKRQSARRVPGTCSAALSASFGHRLSVEWGV